MSDMETAPSVPLICHYNGEFEQGSGSSSSSSSTTVYNGGDMRIVYVDNTIEFSNFISKMHEVCGDSPRTEETNLNVKCSFRLNDHATVLVSVIDDASLHFVLAQFPKESKAIVIYIINEQVKVSKAATTQRSAEDANVKDFEDPLQRTLPLSDLPRTVFVGSGTSPSATEFFSYGNEERTGEDFYDGNCSKSEYNAPRQDQGQRRQNDPARDVSIQILETFSVVTKFARETSTQLFRGSRDCISDANQRVTKFARETSSQLFRGGHHGDRRFSPSERRRRHSRYNERRGILNWASLTFKRTKKNKKRY